MRLPVVSLLVLLTGCQRPATTGADSPAADEPASPRCTQPPAPTSLRRLTRREWQASVAQVLGVSAVVEVPDDEALGFSTITEAQAASVGFSQALLDAAESAAARVELTRVSPCTLDDACAPRFIDQVGRGLFRRPLTSDEAARWLATYRRLREEEVEAQAYRLLTEAMLQAPALLFRLEAIDPRTERLSDDALATRLSFALTGEGPDEALRLAADQGTLRSPEGLAGEARRLLKTPAARRTIGRFHSEWLGTSALPMTVKSDEFPDFAALAPAMEREVEALGAFVVLDDHHLDTLFRGNVTFVDGPLAAVYGFAGIEGADLRQVRLDTKQRSAVLTAPGVLSVWAKSTETSPVLRGRFVRERLLCEVLPTPPPNVAATLPPPGLFTTRERFARHSTDPACAGCHQLIDPIGFGLERYDAVGAFRLTEHDRPIDAHGEVLTSEGTFAFEGARPLGEWLATNPQVTACAMTQWFRFIMGRKETEADACVLDAMTAALTRSGGDVRDALVALVGSDPFRARGPR